MYVRRCLGPFPCLLPGPLEGHPPPPHPVHRGKIEARAQQLGLGRSASPGLGLASLSICVILGALQPDKHGGQSSALVGKDSLEVSRPIPFPDPGPQSRQGWRQREEGWLRDRQVFIRVALRAGGEEVKHSRMGDSQMPQNAE